MKKFTPRGVVCGQQARIFRSTLKRALSLQYLVFLPASYAEGSHQWPLIVFLHGAGERGSDIWKIAKHGPPHIVETNPDFPFIVVSPQCPAGETWSSEAILALLDEVSRSYRVDQRRVYLTGISMGGYASWELLVARPERFAAIAPLCGGGSAIQLRLRDDPKKVRHWKRMPIWAFHGKKDKLVPHFETENMVNLFRNEIGNKDVQFTSYKDLAHDCWTRAYSGSNLFDWFLQHKLPAR